MKPGESQPIRRLILLRHALADDQAASGRDRDRPLAEIGRAQAAAQAGELKSLGVNPDRIIASPARRAAETAAIVTRVLGIETTPDPVAIVYEALPGELIRVLAEHPGREVLLVGHNPGISGLACLLTGETIGLSAGGFALIDFRPPATHPLQPGSGKAGHHRPRPPAG